MLQCYMYEIYHFVKIKIFYGEYAFNKGVLKILVLDIQY